MRRKLVAGNWKMHGLKAQLGEVEAIAAAAAANPQVDVALCVPFTLIAPAVAVAGALPIAPTSTRPAMTPGPRRRRRGGTG